MRLDCRDGAGEEVGVLRGVFLAQRFQLLVGHQHGVGVVAQAARIVVHHALQCRALFAHLQHLVDLFLILDHGDADFGVLQHIDHFLRDGVLVQRHRNRAQRLRGHHGHVETRAVLADDGHVHAGPDAGSGQAVRDLAHVLGDLRPGQRLPDAEVFSRIAGRVPRCCACASSSAGKVSDAAGIDADAGEECATLSPPVWAQGPDAE